MNWSAGSHRLAVDVGGTFIDYVLLDERTGDVVIEKQPASRDHLVDEFMTGVERLPATLDAINLLIHGTTVAINTLVQMKGAKVGLVTTSGFRDVLELGRGGRPDIFALQVENPQTLAPRFLRREVHERVDAAGHILQPLDLRELDAQIQFLVEHDVEAIGIVFLHSYADPTHERQAAEHIRSCYPHMSVSVSSELAREWREFERSSTTVANAFVAPPFARYARQIQERTEAAGLKHPIAFLRSNGGVMPITAAIDQPIKTLSSGPAGGVIGARALLEETEFSNAICADVGGTTYDVSLIRDGDVVERPQSYVDGRPIMGSVIDVISVGAGGGSIASLDPLSSTLRVGPQSAGATPGPACFARGGTEPTVTDAQLVLGLLDGERYLGGRMQVDVDRARTALKQTFGSSRTVVDLADGILAVALANMANAIRQMTTRRGLDPRDFTMISYGGGGGLFAAGVADELNITNIIIPPYAAVFSAWGMLASDYREDTTVTIATSLTRNNYAAILDAFDALAREAADNLAGYGLAEREMRLAFGAGVRYVGQEHTLDVALNPNTVTQRDIDGLDQLPRDFVAQHLERYGHGDPSGRTEVTTLSCQARIALPRPKFAQPRAQAVLEPVAHRDIYFTGHGWAHDVAVYDRAAMALNSEVCGPAVVDEWTTTVIVPHGWAARIDKIGNLRLCKMESTL